MVSVVWTMFLYFFLMQIIIGNCGRDFYNILKIDKSASLRDIKSSYRKLAKEVHPDKNPGDEDASKKFQDLSAAYEVLSDSAKRAKYDECGEECVSKEGMMSNMDPFSSFFGDFFSFGGDSREQKETSKGGTVVMDIHVTLEELYNGNFIELTRNKLVIKEAKGTRKCNCRQEMITKQLGPGRFQMLQQTVCDECPNVKFVNEEKMLEFEIEPGMKDGQETKFFAEGEPHVEGEPGDLILKIRTVPHTIYERRGNDLYTNMTISLQDALVGFKTEIRHLDGKMVEILRESVTSPGTVIKKKGQGMPSYEDNNSYGNMFIRFDINFPKLSFTDEQKSDISKLLNQTSFFKAYNGLRGY